MHNGLYFLFIGIGNCASCMKCLVNTIGKLAGDFIVDGGSHSMEEGSVKKHEQITEDISGGKSKSQEIYVQNYGENTSHEKPSKQNPKEGSYEFVYISSDEENKSV